MRATLKAVCCIPTLVVAACQQPGANLEANVYKAGQVNQTQNARVVTIMMVRPAKIEVDNQQAKAAAQVIGGLAGGIGGALIGSSVGRYHGTNALLGGVAGGATGALAGSLVSDKTLVEGVSLTYKEDGKIRNSAQVGRACDFQRGDTILISTNANETRVQPNAECPLPNKSTI